MTIRRLTLSDLDVLVRFSKETFVAAFAAQNNPLDFSIYVEKAFAPATLESELGDPNAAFFFIENDTEAEPLGFMKINLREKPHDILPKSITQPLDFESLTMMELARIYVREAYHGKGVAQKLMQHAFDLADTEPALRGVQMLWLGVWEHNPKAMRFYEKFGFQKLGAHVFMLGNDPQTDILMGKKIRMDQNE